MDFILKVRCRRCAHEWWPKSPTPPKQCTSADCRSLAWDEVREGDNGAIDLSDLPILSDTYAMQLRATARWHQLTVRVMLEESVEIFLSIPPGRLPEAKKVLRDHLRLGGQGSPKKAVRQYIDAYDAESDRLDT